jgi:hypothetical protein
MKRTTIDISDGVSLFQLGNCSRESDLLLESIQGLSSSS